ncbi:hypothetical protein MHN00_02115 [Alteromonas sp. Cnat2-8]|uniref:hypothetical protein n=1 Tax=Alteromonas sp. Cnat2-8 TaxID=2917728 RepID=UPI001EF5B95C|nr:hypothetical protein [Alteromonas sp. Cnat2-8]MCG7652333.1 hypothetical protein [Alteromonas sp. Cnat2-8]
MLRWVLSGYLLPDGSSGASLCLTWKHCRTRRFYKWPNATVLKIAKRNIAQNNGWLSDTKNLGEILP